jgi:multidrug efflux pump subunit AcrA (membrane-fusion protein)
VNQATRNVLVRARVENTEARLLPGMFANVNVIYGEPREVVTLPRTAVTYSLYGDSVYVVVEAAKTGDKPGASATEAPGGAKAEQTPATGKPAEPQLVVDRRFVRVGEARGDRVAILGGVKPGEQVVVTGQVKLQPQARVKVDNSVPLTAPAERPLE